MSCWIIFKRLKDLVLQENILLWTGYRKFKLKDSQPHRESCWLKSNIHKEDIMTWYEWLCNSSLLSLLVCVLQLCPCLNKSATSNSFMVNPVTMRKCLKYETKSVCVHLHRSGYECLGLQGQPFYYNVYFNYSFYCTALVLKSPRWGKHCTFKVTSIYQEQ